jgi:hypothetical protein
MSTSSPNIDGEKKDHILCRTRFPSRFGRNFFENPNVRQCQECQKVFEGFWRFWHPVGWRIWENRAPL